MTAKTTRIIWIVALVALGMATAMNLLGGIGTVCAAFLTEKFPPMRVLLDYQWLYQRMMLIRIGIGIVGIWATVGLFRGGPNAYRAAVAVLVAGTVLGELHMRASLELRGKMVPANVVFYINLFTLILFLILGLPSIGKYVSFSRPRGRTEAAAAAGMAAMVVGVTILTVGLWVGDTHTFEGTDWTEAFQPWLSIAGVLFTGGGLAVFVKAVLAVLRQPETVAWRQPVVTG